MPTVRAESTCPVPAREPVPPQVSATAGLRQAASLPRPEYEACPSGIALRAFFLSYVQAEAASAVGLLGRSRNRVVPQVFLHIRQAQEQLQEFGALLGQFCHAVLGKQPNCEIPLLNQPINRFGVEGLPLLAEFERPGDSSERVVQVMAQTNTMAAETGRNSSGTRSHLARPRLSSHR